MHNADALPHAPASRAVQAARATIARLYLETAAHAASYPPPPPRFQVAHNPESLPRADAA